MNYMLERMGFSLVWRKWIRTCICSNSVSILVNGSSTEDFNVGKGLRQGDPLAPFLFLVVAEGLAGLVQKAVSIGRLKGYMVSDAISFPLLQFADDTILICEASWENLWSVKTILRSFELVSSLRVNFSKSNIFGLNLQDSFLSAASHFLSCCIGSFPFKFLGLPVGANPRRCSTWEPIVDSLKKRLAAWKGRYLSIGGRITLINSVLSSLPLYFFSFFKAPKKVLKSLVAIQRKFLWNGCGESQKINWVCWEKVCLPKDKGGLGVKILSGLIIAY